MPTLKQLHESLIQEEIKRNHFLSKLHEASMIRNFTPLIKHIDKMDDMAKNMGFMTLTSAFSNALDDAKRIATFKTNSPRQKKKALEIGSKVVTFMSKMSDFFGKDLPNIKAINLRNFFKNAADDDVVGSHSDAIGIDEVIKQALIKDASPWYKKALTFLTGSSEWISDVPYLDIDSFAAEFLGKTKTELQNAIDVAVGGSSLPPVTITPPLPPPPPITPPPSDGTAAVNTAITALDDVVAKLQDKFPTIATTITSEKVAALLFVGRKKFDDIVETDFTTT